MHGDSRQTQDVHACILRRQNMVDSLWLKRLDPLMKRVLFRFSGLVLTLNLFLPNAYASQSGCTAKIKASTDRMIWGGDPLPYSTDIIFGAQQTERVMDGPELITIGGTPIPRIYLYDIKSACNTLGEWDGDRFYYMKWYRN